MNRTWHLGSGQPRVELFDRDGNSFGTIDLDMPKPDGAANIAVAMANGHKPERTTTIYGDGAERDIPHGYRYYAHLYYPTTESTGRAICIAIVQHLMADAKNYVKFWPYRDVANNWHICKLDEDPDVDTLIEYRAIGYSLTLSLKTVRREYALPGAVETHITNFNDNALVYVGGDHVRNFASVAAAYIAGDLPAYFSKQPSGGEADLPDY